MGYIYNIPTPGHNSVNDTIFLPIDATTSHPRKRLFIIVRDCIDICPRYYDNLRGCRKYNGWFGTSCPLGTGSHPTPFTPNFNTL